MKIIQLTSIATLVKISNFDGYFLVNNDGGITFELNGLKYKDVNLGIIANIRNK